MKTLVTTLLLLSVLSSKTTFSQNKSNALPSYDMILYTNHYFLHICTDSNKIHLHKVQKVKKDTIINSVHRDKNGWDSLVVQYPFKERIDSSELIITDTGGKRMKISSFSFLVTKEELVPFFMKGSVLNKEAIDEINAIKKGQELAIRGIMVLPEGQEYYHQSLPFFVYVR